MVVPPSSIPCTLYRTTASSTVTPCVVLHDCNGVPSAECARLPVFATNLHRVSLPRCHRSLGISLSLSISLSLLPTTSLSYRVDKLDFLHNTIQVKLYFYLNAQR